MQSLKKKGRKVAEEQLLIIFKELCLHNKVLRLEDCLYQNLVKESLEPLWVWYM